MAGLAFLLVFWALAGAFQRHGECVFLFRSSPSPSRERPCRTQAALQASGASVRPKERALWSVVFARSTEARSSLCICTIARGGPRLRSSLLRSREPTRRRVGRTTERPRATRSIARERDAGGRRLTRRRSCRTRRRCSRQSSKAGAPSRSSPPSRPAPSSGWGRGQTAVTRVRTRKRRILLAARRGARAGIVEKGRPIERFDLCR